MAWCTWATPHHRSPGDWSGLTCRWHEQAKLQSGAWVRSSCLATRSPKPHLEAAALSAAIDPALVIAVAAAESAFNTEAVSRKGALGLMQVMPATAERYGVAAHSTAEGRKAMMEPKVNAQIGSRYLADLLRLFDGDRSWRWRPTTRRGGRDEVRQANSPLYLNATVCGASDAVLPHVCPVM